MTGPPPTPFIEEDDMTSKAELDTVSITDDAAADDGGFTTAELLANAALAIGVLLVIWLAMRQLGVDFVDWIRVKLQM